MAGQYARCTNSDYCSLADQRLVLRLDVGEPFFCPECAHKLLSARPWGSQAVPWPFVGALGMAGAAAWLVMLLAQQWPRAANDAFDWVQSRVAAVKAAPSTEDPMPAPAKYFLLAAMDSDTEHKFGHYLLRPRRLRPPRADRLEKRAFADLQQGVPSVPWPQDEAQGAGMSWRQALILSALVTPRAMPDAPPGPMAIVPPPPLPAPVAAPPPAPKKLPRPRADLRDVRPLAMPSPRSGQEVAMRQTQNLLEDAWMRSTETPAIVRLVPALPPHLPPPWAEMQEPGANPSPAVRSAEAEIPPILRAPKAPTPIESAAPPVKEAAASIVPKPKAGDNIAAPRLVVVRKIAKPARLAKSVTVAVAKLSEPPPVQAVFIDSAPPPVAKSVAVRSDFQMSFTPLQNVNLSAITIPARPVSDNPRSGSLKVDCVIETSGVPTDCRVLHADRAAAVSSALVAWLGSGLVHRAPAVRDGHPIRARQVWTLEFPAEAKRVTSVAGADSP